MILPPTLHPTLYFTNSVKKNQPRHFSLRLQVIDLFYHDLCFKTRTRELRITVQCCTRWATEQVYYVRKASWSWLCDATVNVLVNKSCTMGGHNIMGREPCKNKSVINSCEKQLKLLMVYWLWCSFQQETICILKFFQWAYADINMLWHQSCISYDTSQWGINCTNFEGLMTCKITIMSKAGNTVKRPLLFEVQSVLTSAIWGLIAVYITSY